MSDYSLFVTFWTGAAIMFVAFLLSAYFTRTHSDDYEDVEIVEAGV